MHLKVRMARYPWEGYHVPDVLQSGHEHDKSLKSEPETRMGYGSVSSKISIPPYVAGLHAALHTPPLKHVQLVLPLRPSDELP